MAASSKKAASFCQRSSRSSGTRGRSVWNVGEGATPVQASKPRAEAPRPLRGQNGPAATQAWKRRSPAGNLRGLNQLDLVAVRILDKRDDRPAMLHGPGGTHDLSTARA